TVVTDVTEFKRQEAALGKRTAYLETLIENLDHGAVLFDENLATAASNARYSEILGLPSEFSKPGITLEAIFQFRAWRGDYGPGDPAALAADRIQRIRELDHFMHEDTLPDGRIVKLANIKLPRGGMVATVVDVTARRKVEADRQSSEAYFRMMANSAPVMVWACDEAGQITFLNRRWLEFRGGSLEQELAHPWADIVHPDDAANFFAAFDEAISTRQTHTCEYRLRRHDGQYRWIISTAVPRVDGGGALAGFIGSALDITDRKRDEDMLRQAKDQAVAASRTKSELLANMSHELRTPLNAIIGFSEIMRDEMFGSLGHVSYQEYAHDIHESGKHLLTLINDILDVSKAEAGKIELDEELVEVRLVIETCVRLVKARAEASNLALEIRLPGSPPKLFADERRVKQIFLNLLSNAVKFTLPGGRVHVDAIQRADGSLALTVNDTGIGIAPEDLPRVLAPFGQAESGLNRKYEGTGLGLTLTKALVELHGGELEIDSVKGVGTKVSAVFPAARVRASDTLPEPLSARGRLRRARAVGAH
ncbi:MAG: PAS-domain containing protein, partial [Alphaproteobacteria bacterium]